MIPLVNNPGRLHRFSKPGLPFLEALESRLLLSGNVTASVSDGGDLLLVGDRSDNRIVIDQAGLPDGEFQISSEDGTTTINGGTDPVVLTGITGNVRVRLGDGNDAVTIDQVSLPSSLLIDGGKGNNSVDINASTVGRNVLIKNKKGDQTFSLLNGSAVGGIVKLDNDKGDNAATIQSSTVAGDVFFKSKDGPQLLVLADSDVDGNVKVNSNKGDNTTRIDTANIAGNLLVNNKAGTNTFDLINSTVSINVKVDNHKGDSASTVDSTTISGQLFIKSKEGSVQVSVQNGSSVLRHAKIHTGNGGSTVSISGAIGANLQVRGGRGLDHVYLTGLTVARRTKVHTGSGNDTVSIDDLTATGAVSIKTDKGADIIEVETAGLPDGPESSFARIVKIDAGADDDLITVGVEGEAGNSAVFDAAILINGSRGQDTLDWIDHGNTIGGRELVKGIETTI